MAKWGHFGFYRIVRNSFSLIHPQWSNKVILDFIGFYRMVLALYIHSDRIGSFFIFLGLYRMVLVLYLHSGKIGSSAILKGFYRIVLAGFIHSGKIGSF